jgi:hypothetical protein
LMALTELPIKASERKIERQKGVGSPAPFVDRPAPVGTGARANIFGTTVMRSRYGTSHSSNNKCSLNIRQYTDTHHSMM